jgi:hypothetical protein
MFSPGPVEKKSAALWFAIQLHGSHYRRSAFLPLYVEQLGFSIAAQRMGAGLLLGLRRICAFPAPCGRLRRPQSRKLMLERVNIAFFLVM